MTLQFSRRFRLTATLLTLCVLGMTIYLYFTWWIPNQKMSDPEWWQNASHAELRNISHEVLRFPVGNHHDAFLTLASVGNEKSVPLLIHSLTWQTAPDPDGFSICTTEHAVDALQSLTGQDFGFEPERWNKWWAESGSRLPASSIHSRMKSSKQTP